MRSIQIRNTTSGISQTLEASASSSQSQGFNFPGTAGTAGQLVTVLSTTNGVATTQWSTPQGSFSSNSSVLAVASTDGNTTWASGQAITLAVGSYRVVGEFDAYRGTQTTDADAILFRVNATTGAGSARYILECLDCPANTVIDPVLQTMADVTATNVNVSVNPGGATAFGGPTNVFHYRFEGVITMTTAGSVSLQFNKNTGTGSSVIDAGSYWTSIPLP